MLESMPHLSIDNIILMANLVSADVFAPGCGFSILRSTGVYVNLQKQAFRHSFSGPESPHTQYVQSPPESYNSIILVKFRASSVE